MPRSGQPPEESAERVNWPQHDEQSDSAVPVRAGGSDTGGADSVGVDSDSPDPADVDSADVDSADVDPAGSDAGGSEAGASDEEAGSDAGAEQAVAFDWPSMDADLVLEPVQRPAEPEVSEAERSEPVERAEDADPDPASAPWPDTDRPDADTRAEPAEPVGSVESAAQPVEGQEQPREAEQEEPAATAQSGDRPARGERVNLFEPTHEPAQSHEPAEPHEQEPQVSADPTVRSEPVSLFEPTQPVPPAQPSQPTRPIRHREPTPPPKPPRPTEPPRTSELPRTSEPPRPAEPSRTAEPPRPTEPPRTAELPRTSEPPRTTGLPRTSESTVVVWPVRPEGANEQTLSLPKIPAATEWQTSSVRTGSPAPGGATGPVAPPAGRTMPVRIEPADTAETTVEPEQPAEAPPPRRPRRRGRRVLVGALVLVLVVAVAAGVLFLVPGVASKVGLPRLGPLGGDTPDPPAPVRLTPALRAAVGTAASARGVDAAMAKVTGDPALAKLTGEVIDPRSGESLWSSGATTPLAPGSTNKLLTAAAALLTLDHQATFTTRVVAGDKPGSVVIVGGGDPTLSSLPDGKDGVYPGAAHLDDLVKQVERSGEQVSEVSVDLDRYTGDPIAPGWSKADIKAGNFTPIVPAMLDGGRNDPTGADAPRTDNPAGDLAAEFASRIGASPAGQASAPKGAKVLGEVHSAPIEDLVANMLEISDNVLAEAVGREVARATGNGPSFGGATKAVLNTLRRNGLDTTGAIMADCSGLSTQDRLPARLLAAILAASAKTGTDDVRTAKLRPMLTGLPVAGGTGTLDEGHDRFQGSANSSGRGYVQAKTGTLTGVSTLAGVVLDSDDRVLVFAMMSNGSVPAEARPALDAIATRLRECGCG